ncbi:MAG: hypothetical protein ABFR33_06415 [Verrucomicrobiota bacterium]
MVSMQPGSGKGTDWDERVEVIGQKGRVTAHGFNWEGEGNCTLKVETDADTRNYDFDYEV